MKLLSALMLVALTVSGCLSSDSADDGSPSEGSSADQTPLEPRRTETFRLLDPAFAGDQNENMFSFDLGSDVAYFMLEADWSCVSLCPLKFWVTSPDGTVVARDEGWGWSEKVLVDDAAGTWTVTYTARDEASVGIVGEATITVY